MDSLNADNYDMLSGGPLTNHGTFSVLAGNGGTRYIRVAVVNSPGATMSVAAGDTRFDSNTSLTNNGTVAVNDGGNIAFSGGSTYNMASTATLQVTADANNDTGYGMSGSGISVAGKLKVVPVGTPASGQSFMVIYNAVTGTFSSVTTGWSASYGGTGVTVAKS
jgi:hypothetical protein